MTQSILEFQLHHSILREVILRQRYLAIEYGNCMLSLQFLWHGVVSMAFHAECIAFGAEKMIIFTAVRRVAGRTALPEGRLMVYRFLLQISNVGMATKTDINGIRLGKPRLSAGMWAVAISAIAGGAGMLDLGLLNQFSLVGVAGYAE